jgi:alkylation response protein AidB-like acyl-CoA dehydrogenase
MRFALSDDQAEFAAIVRQFFQARSPLSEVRRQMMTDDGFDRSLWRQMADQLGLQGIAIPDEFGGSGQTLVELGIVLREAGRALSSTPLFASAALCTQVLICADDQEASATWLPGLASGEVIGTVALAGDSAEWALSADGVEGRLVDQEYRLTGRRTFVLHGHVADLVLVSAATPEGLSLFGVAGDAPGVSRRAEDTLDPTRRQATLTFDDVPARLIGTAGGAEPDLKRALRLGAIALAQEQVGAAEHCLDMAVGYAKTRKQYGRPIGSFQAIKHMCADALVEIESAKAAADYATLAASIAPDELPVVASLAQAFCADAFFMAASQNIQVHGGIGFTWEHDAHLYFKRATTMAQYLGSPSAHRECVAALVLQPGESAPDARDEITGPRHLARSA